MKLLFLGDLFYNYNNISEEIFVISEALECKDHYVIVNLEGPITTSNKMIRKRGEHLRQSPNVIDVLKILNVQCVTLANNHIMDFGCEGLLDTISILSANNIRYIGAGKNVHEATRPLIINDGELDVIIHNSGWDVEESVYATSKSPGCAPYDLRSLKGRIYPGIPNKQKQIFINHCGFEYNLFPSPRDIDIAHKLVNFGADLVINHHPHVIQPVEKYRDKLICYSLGNFYFSSFRDEFSVVKDRVYDEKICNPGMVVECTVDCCAIQTNLLFLTYDEYDRQTRVCEKEPKLFRMISDAWELTMNKFQKDYIDLVKTHRNNITPTLSKNQLIAWFQIRVLHIIYGGYRFISRIGLVDLAKRWFGGRYHE